MSVLPFGGQHKDARVGTIRQECLDWLIPLTESHLWSILKLWIAHYNTGRPHMATNAVITNANW
jgi:hypothetical protein